ncbi:MAG: DUF6142 family protein [Lachnospiraceae bacterium]
MHRRGYMFTGRSHSDNGKMSATLGLISFVSMCLVIYLSYRLKGAMSPKLGAATFFALLISIAGETLGVMSRMEKDKFYLFPNIGLILNSLSLFIIICLLYMGIYDI